MAEPNRIVSDLVIERLRAWRVPRVFGHPAEAVSPLIDALRRANDEPAFVSARTSGTAAFMATGHAKYTGAVGVCLAAHGPGTVLLQGGLYDAKLDGTPVVALVGQPPFDTLGGAYRDIEPHRLLGDVCGQFLRVANRPEQVQFLLDQAFRTAVATRSPVCLVLPVELQGELATPGPGYLGEIAAAPPAPGLPPARVVPHEADLNAAAQLLASGNRVAIVVGRGGYGAADEIVALADRLEAGVATSLLGKPILDERLPFHTGVLGHVGTAASAQLMAGCDTLLLVGTTDPWTGYYPVPGQARAVQIDIDGRRVGSRYPVDVPLIGDAAETLRALLPRVPSRRNQDWRGMIEMSTDRWREEARRRVGEPAEPVNPRLVVHELSSRLPRRAAVAVDVGSATYWYARHLQLQPGVSAQLSGTLGAVGSALPYGIAAKLADPEHPVFVLAGDAAMQAGGLTELVTVAQCWPEWPDPRFVVLVLNNRNRSGQAGQSPRGSESLDGDRADLPYAGWARLLGLHGVRVDRPELVGSAWDEALAADRPTLIEAMVDPATPLDPPEEPFADLRETGLLGLAGQVREPALAEYGRRWPGYGRR